MSAENMLQMFYMVDNTFQIRDVRSGDIFMECQGESHLIFSASSYEETAKRFCEMSDEEHPNYYYTEHEGTCPSEEELWANPHSLKSLIFVYFDRECGCVDVRDLERRQWKVMKVDCSFGYTYDRDPGLLKGGLSYAEAMNYAFLYANFEPGEVIMRCPKFFRLFHDYGNHDCFRDDGEVHVDTKEVEADRERFKR